MTDQKPFVVDRADVEPFSPPHHEETESVELLTPEKGSDEVVFRISTVGPGGRDHWHAHEASEQIMYVLSGEARIWLGEPSDDDRDNATEHGLEPESFVYIPRDVHHEIRVPEDGDALEVIVLWAPPYESFDEWDPDED